MDGSNVRPSAATNAAGRELVLTRVFDAPRELVFKAWTDPKHVAQWWGPHGFTNPVCELDVRPGGAIRIHMRGPDGTVYPMTGVYQEIVEPTRLVFTSAALDEEGNPLFEVLHTVTFAEQGSKTTLTVKARVVKSTAEAAPYLDGMEAGWTQSLERLETHLRGKGTMATRHKPTGGTADREIIATRVFDSPRELVFKMWTDPKHVARWWGPKGFTNTIYEMDVRPGGVWRFVMHGPDGVDYQNKIVYAEIVKPERIVYSHVSGPQFQVTATFAEQGHKTKLTVRMFFESAAQRDKVVKEFGAVEGLNQTLGRLEEQLARMSAEGSAGREFVITRVFDAPRELVFKAWTESERLARWWGPKGFTWVSAKLDLRPGGVFHYCMRSPDGREMWGKFVYREILAPERIVFVNSFSDEEGNTVRAPFSSDWPLEVLNTLTLAEHEGRTMLTLRGYPINATESERKAFEAGYESMKQGFKGTLDQLAHYLAKA